MMRLLVFAAYLSVIAIADTLSTNGDVLAELRALRSEVTSLRRVVDAIPATNPCDTEMPFLSGESATAQFSGCNRNILRNTTEMVEVCEAGQITYYNQNSSSGGFDMKIAIHQTPADAYHFVCYLSRFSPHVATCTLTFEEPARPEGPAWVQVTFDRVFANPKTGRCESAHATVIGTYFYEYSTSAAGVYVFYATPMPSERALPLALR